jgi:hypothetical protein
MDRLRCVKHPDTAQPRREKRLSRFHEEKKLRAWFDTNNPQVLVKNDDFSLGLQLLLL